MGETDAGRLASGVNLNALLLDSGGRRLGRS